MSIFTRTATAAGLVCLLSRAPFVSAQAPASSDDATTSEILGGSEQFVQAFNAARSEVLVAMFHPRGELIDEQGNVYHGAEELGTLFKRFFESFPGAKLEMEVESVRVIGSNCAIVEGTRYVASDNPGVSEAHLGFVSVRTKSPDGKWLIASLREFDAEPEPTPHDFLQPLAWIVGDWVNEGEDAVVKIGYRWSDDSNFLLGDFEVIREGETTMKSSQRIGWDPLRQQLHSWLFDADGGYSTGHLTPIDESWVMKSLAVAPTGETGSATMTISRPDTDHFTLKGTDRIVAGAREPEFEVTVTRKPPAAGN